MKVLICVDWIEHARPKIGKLMALANGKRLDNRVALEKTRKKLERRIRMWVKCKDELPPEDSICKIMYSNGKITTGLYRGNRMWIVYLGESDKSVYVEYWWKEGELKKAVQWKAF